MAATPAWAVASSLVRTTRTLYLRSGGGAFLLLLPADAAAGSVRARTARADPATLHHLPCELRIRASLLPGASPDSPWVRHPRQRGPASSGSPASWPLQLRWVATEPNRPFVTLQAEVRGSDADLCRRAIQAAMNPLQKRKKRGAPRAAAPLRRTECWVGLRGGADPRALELGPVQVEQVRTRLAAGDRAEDEEELVCPRHRDRE